MTSDLLVLVVRANLVAAVAILLILALRPTMARRFGARVVYALWAVAPLAVLASLVPARRVVVEIGPAAQMLIAQPARGVMAVADTVVVQAAQNLDPTPWLLGFWALGAGLSLALLVWRQRSFGRSLGALRPEAGVYRAEAAGVGPAVVGVLFPRIVLPSDFEARFAPEEREIVLAHEQVHFRRGDPLVNGLVALARCLCWFNPLVHVAAFYVRLDQELACDAAVIARFPGARKRYAEAMLKTQLSPMAAPLACYWPARSAHPMKHRIAMLKATPPDATRRLAGLGLVAAVSVGAGFTAWAAQPARIEAVSQARPPSVSPVANRLGAQLVEAIDEGYPDTIRKLVSAGADVNHYVPGEGTPLVQAARLGDLRTARLLLARGAQVDKAAPGDGAPLITAAAHGRFEMVALLVAAGADVNQYVRHDETPLINATRTGDIGVIRYLIDHGADPNLAVPSGNLPGEMRSPLSMAANTEVADYLKSRGARR